MLTRTLDSSSDTLDVRDLIERCEELRTERDDLQGAIDTAKADADGFDPEQGGGDEVELQQAIAATERDLEAWSDEYASELSDLESVLADLKGTGGDEQWNGHWYPLTLIRYDHFTDHCKELAEEFQYLNSDFPTWIEIDWEATARNMKVNYQSVDIDGVEFYYR